MVYLQRVKRNMIRGLMAGLVILVLMLIANSSSNTYQSSNSINFLAVPFVLVWFGLIAFGFTRPYPTDKRKITIILLSVSTSIVVFGYLYCFVMFPSAFQVPPDWNFFDKIGVSLMFIVPIIFCALYQYLSPIRKESDVKEAGLEKGEIIEERILQNPKVKQFYENTMTAWANGKMDDINQDFKRLGKLPYEKFIKSNKPKKYNALYIFFSQFERIDDEFLMGVGENDYGTNRAWLILTNKRLIQRDGVDNKFKEIILSEVDEYKLNHEHEIQLSFKMKSGNFIEFRSAKLLPDENYLKKAIKGF